ncbi:restriction endonuclease [Halorubrum ezzemoulense]|uniref:restriction endonuclease n=1 Tax=Halorubrum ezzemoulense TaxID=337243 RepID=UPI00232AED45|nr:restriction endonuclease [Halorubrum ezzemoulense]MDB2276544.1 restriction endonuclease [Halorubrum ezzemoulense]
MSSLGNVLETIDEQNFRDSDLGYFFYDRIAHELADAFGIDRDFVHTMRNIGEGLKPTAIVQVNENKRAWAVFEVVPSYMEDRKKKAERMMKKYLHYTNAGLGVVFAPSYVVVFDTDGTVLHDIDTEDESEVRRINQVLSPPEIFLDDVNAQETDGNRSQDYVIKPNYEIDLKEFEDALEAMDSADTSQERGDAFEEFAGILMEAMPFIRVRERNLRSRTNELDLVVEYTGADDTKIFDKVSSDFLIECKHWSEPVGSDPVGNFIQKMDKLSVDFGIIFARNGITGDEQTDGYGQIRDAFIQSDKVILVIDDGDIERLLGGKSLYNILDEKYYNRRFDRK